MPPVGRKRNVKVREDLRFIRWNGAVPGLSGWQGGHLSCRVALARTSDPRSATSDCRRSRSRTGADGSPDEGRDQPAARRVLAWLRARQQDELGNKKRQGLELTVKVLAATVPPQGVPR